MNNQSDENYDLIVAGGGAAGFFAAISAAEAGRGLKIVILEKSKKILSKVKISGGGRCNVTHNCLDAIELSRHYPRGEKVLKRIFKSYSTQQTIDWFKEKGVDLKAEGDGRMFPTTDNSQTIIDCFVKEAIRHQVRIELGEGVQIIESIGYGYKIRTSSKVFIGKKLLIAVGGNPNNDFYQWIAALGHTIIPPIPSLFTFNDSEKGFADLMGVAVQNAEVRIATTKFVQGGPVLITHWGLSGPAVIRLSAWAAEYLHSVGYKFTVLVNWIGKTSEDDLRSLLQRFQIEKAKQRVLTNAQFGLPQRLWTRGCELAGIDEHRIWAEVSKKNLNKLVEFLIRSPFQMQGKTTFKEEFVTCGGIDLREIDPDTMESLLAPGVFFAGEVLNVDGETGGFNFQAAWSSGHVAAKAIVASLTKTI